MICKISYGLSVAGHDPCGGAGLTVDAAVFNHFGIKPLTVCSAVTVQDPQHFYSANWVEDDLVMEQLKAIVPYYQPAVTKIGIIRSPAILVRVLIYLKEHSPSSLIVWDPVLSASSGFKLNGFSSEELSEILSLVDFVLPNKKESELLSGSTDPSKAAEILLPKKGIVVKSAFLENGKVVDLLFDSNGETRIERMMVGEDKHGTGCVYSTAFASGIVKGDFQKAAEKAGNMVASYRSSGAGKEGVLDFTSLENYELQL